MIIVTAYSLKHSRDLVRAITIKVQGKTPVSDGPLSLQNPNSLLSRVEQIQADLTNLSFPRQPAFS